MAAIRCLSGNVNRKVITIVLCFMMIASILVRADPGTPLIVKQIGKLHDLYRLLAEIFSQMSHLKNCNPLMVNGKNLNTVVLNILPKDFEKNVDQFDVILGDMLTWGDTSEKTKYMYERDYTLSVFSSLKCHKQLIGINRSTRAMVNHVRKLGWLSDDFRVTVAKGAFESLAELDEEEMWDDHNVEGESALGRMERRISQMLPPPIPRTEGNVVPTDHAAESTPNVSSDPSMNVAKDENMEMKEAVRDGVVDLGKIADDTSYQAVSGDDLSKLPENPLPKFNEKGRSQSTPLVPRTEMTNPRH